MTTCYYCGVYLTKPDSVRGLQFDTTATIDHVIPVSRGGNKNRGSKNCVWACYGCNQGKKDHTVSELLKMGWRFGMKIKNIRAPRADFNWRGKKHSQKRIERVSYWKHFSMLKFALDSHVDIWA